MEFVVSRRADHGNRGRVGRCSAVFWTAGNSGSRQQLVACIDRCSVSRRGLFIQYDPRDSWRGFYGHWIGVGFFLWRFSANGRPRGSKVSGNLFLELLWTIVPACVLVFLALHQLPYWQKNKEQHPVMLFSNGLGDNVQVKPIVRVEAFQYGWRFVYSGNDEEFDTRDDIISENELLLPAGEEVVLELISLDVIHSFAINPLRLKQDIVPGLRPHVWFEITEPGEWEINCMELCGWGHFRMAAKLRVVTRVEYDLWELARRKEQHGY